jgi:hypothetical protein
VQEGNTQPYRPSSGDTPPAKRSCSQPTPEHLAMAAAAPPPTATSPRLPVRKKLLLEKMNSSRTSQLGRQSLRQEAGLAEPTAVPAKAAEAVTCPGPAAGPAAAQAAAAQAEAMDVAAPAEQQHAGMQLFTFDSTGNVVCHPCQAISGSSGQRQHAASGQTSPGTGQVSGCLRPCCTQ